MKFHQGRVWANNADQAVKRVRIKYGEGELKVRELPVENNTGLTWFEYSIEVEETKPPQL